MELHARLRPIAWSVVFVGSDLPAGGVTNRQRCVPSDSLEPCVRRRTIGTLGRWHRFISWRRNAICNGVCATHSLAVWGDTRLFWGDR
ncbi:hypothetical protein EJ06DRAFT_361513 [Trichodelitschia bisporula]|uniref:Uncharacterized protein n=1 Tax=Trichodelitschia bisporula TaxID=703511 RepID=A0A6G1I0G2_9PEZI|nr:hypothetical protein EJ06DRAFT_361513 [Trichodelitschia bisporula]